MSALSAAVAFVLAHKVAILFACTLGVKFLQAVDALLLLAWPQSKFLLDAEAFMTALIVHLPTTETRARFRRPAPRPSVKPPAIKPPGVLPDLGRSDTPTLPGGAPLKLQSLLGALAVVALIVAGRAEAQVFSAGASLPMLEFQPSQVHPVVFAPGLGVEASVGLFQTELIGEQWDLLDFTVQLFGNAPGSMQAALGIGTLNNLIFVAAAVPLYAAAGGGAFQGAFNVFPVLGGSIPFELGSFSPPTEADSEALKLRRGGTVYLPL